MSVSLPRPCLVFRADQQQVFHTYTYSTAAWLSLQSLPLIAGPSMIVSMLLDETRPASGMCLPRY